MDYSKIKLGAIKPEIDTRRIMLHSFLNYANLPPLPASYNYDTVIGMTIPDGMDKNDVLGDCVIAAQAKQVRRFEAAEQGVILNITDQNISDRYFAQTGGPDVGLDTNQSLRLLRKDGWDIGSNNYKIYAYASVNSQSPIETKYGILLFGGVQVTLGLPMSAQQEVVWESTTDNVGSWGWHQVYTFGWNSIGPLFLTWGTIKQMTWAFYFKYCPSCFAVIDDRDSWDADSPVDTDKLSLLLQQAINDPGAPVIVSIVPNSGKQGQQIQQMNITTQYSMTSDMEPLFGDDIDINPAGVHIGWGGSTMQIMHIDSMIIGQNAKLGKRKVGLNNGQVFGYLPYGFEVLEGDNMTTIKFYSTVQVQDNGIWKPAGLGVNLNMVITRPDGSSDQVPATTDTNGIATGQITGLPGPYKGYAIVIEDANDLPSTSTEDTTSVAKPATNVTFKFGVK
jgi:hypothetical protein